MPTSYPFDPNYKLHINKIGISLNVKQLQKLQKLAQENNIKNDVYVINSEIPLSVGTGLNNRLQLSGEDKKVFDNLKSIYFTANKHLWLDYVNKIKTAKKEPNYVIIKIDTLKIEDNSCKSIKISEDSIYDKFHKIFKSSEGIQKALALHLYGTEQLYKKIEPMYETFLEDFDKVDDINTFEIFLDQRFIDVFNKFSKKEYRQILEYMKIKEETAK